MSRYDYYACSNCGQLVAHTKGGKPLHMHARSQKCRAWTNVKKHREKSEGKKLEG